MNTSDRSMKYDKTFMRYPKERKNYLASRVNKFQELVNRTSVSPSADQAE